MKGSLAGFGLALLVILSACSTDEAQAAVDPVAPLSETESASGSAGPRMPCQTEPDQPTFSQPPEPSTAELLRLTAELYECAESVVILDRDALDLYGQASETALVRQIPLLVVEQATPEAEMTAVAEEVARLDPAEVMLFGEVSSEVLTGLDRVVDVRSFRSLGTADVDPAEIQRLVRSSDPSGPTFLITIDEAPESMITLPALTLGEYGVEIIDPTDPDEIERLRDQARTGVEYIVPNDWDPTDRWRIDVALAGTELPGGGTEMFPGRRLVALYGSPVTYRLGALGEQDPEQTLERLAPIVESYETDEHPIVIPSFELIATVATGSAGNGGNYSQELDPERMQPWIDFATDNDVFVVIDLQPGRADFLTQAKLYEEFLRLPNVGLALDPEWRLGPSERPLQRIGSVDAAEVNEVVDWLVELVREEALPQKPLILHQFLRRMLPDRELIATPPELAVVVHVDGQGSLGSKFATFDSMSTADQDPDQTLWWGWKNFYDEDSSVTSPERVNAVEPLPMVITFQ